MNTTRQPLVALTVALASFVAVLPAAHGQSPAAPPGQTLPAADEPDEPGLVQSNAASVAPLLPDDYTLGTSRRRIRLGLDPVDSLLKVELWTTAVYYGLLTGSTIFFAAADLRGDVGGPLLVVPVAGALTGTYFLAHRAPALHAGVLAALDLGIWAGAMDGMLIGRLAAYKNSDKTQDRAAVAAGFGVASLAGAGGAMLAKKLGATKGDVGLLATTTFWGAATGLLINLTALGDERKLGSRIGKNSSSKEAWAILAGSLTGTAIGAGLISKLDVSRTRAIFLDLGGITGASIGVAIAQAVPKYRGETRPFGAFVLGGELLGLAAAALLTHKLDAKLPTMPLEMRVAPTALPVQSRRTGQVDFVPGMALSAAF